MTQDISLIAIVARDGAIGIGGDQPFHIADDFRRFKALTLGHPIVMGRRTFEALPKGALPGRRNIVVSRQADWSAHGAERASSLTEAIDLAADTDEIMIIGGGEIYRQAMPIATKLYITQVDAAVEGADTYFPDIDPELWTLAETSDYMVDSRSGARYRFTIYCRNSGI